MPLSGIYLFTKDNCNDKTNLTTDLEIKLGITISDIENELKKTMEKLDISDKHLN